METGEIILLAVYVGLLVFLIGLCIGRTKKNKKNA